MLETIAALSGEAVNEQFKKIIGIEFPGAELVEPEKAEPFGVALMHEVQVTDTDSPVDEQNPIVTTLCWTSERLQRRIDDR